MGNHTDIPTVRRFRKQPVIIEAVQFTGEPSAFYIGGWAQTTAAIVYVRRGYDHAMRHEHEYDSSNGHILDTAPEYLVIPTLEGNHRADLGDWIIRGVAEEYYPCKADIFAETYEDAQ